MSSSERKEREIVLVCNPGAGGHWRELAGILDAEEAQHARRIVTDEIDDITSSLRRFRNSAKLVCVYGGDGTILKIINSIFPNKRDEAPLLAFIGGGTMNVSARWCGWTQEPAVNFARVVRQFLEDRLLTRDVPLLEVTQGESQRFGFTFVAHAVGDANRSGRVERPFYYIETNFYPGRTFASVADLNIQLAAWCADVERKRRRTLGKASSIELFAIEQPAMQPLPIFVPEVYGLHTRRVDVEGYVSLHTHRYSVPVDLIGRQVEVRESTESMRVFDGHALIAEHPLAEHGDQGRSTLPEHRVSTRQRRQPAPPCPEEKLLRDASQLLNDFVTLLRDRLGGKATRPVMRLHRIYIEYPTESVNVAIARALQFGLTDMARVERMVIAHVAGDYFRIPRSTEDSHGHQEEAP
jgi:hypothetical protein